MPKSAFAACPCQQPQVSTCTLPSSNPIFDPSLPYDHLFPPSSVLPPARPNTDPRCNSPPPSDQISAPVPSSLIVEAWEFFLHDYPDKKFVSSLLHIIRFGANIGFIGQPAVQSCDNLKLALANAD